jgi:hypothetical protein
MFGGIVVIHDVTDDGIQNRITEKLHPFVVDPFPVAIRRRAGTMEKSHFVIAYVFRIEAYDSM